MPPRIAEDTAFCQKCGKLIDIDEWVINWGWCDNCFTEDFEQYIEESAGPFDSLIIPQSQ